MCYLLLWVYVPSLLLPWINALQNHSQQVSTICQLIPPKTEERLQCEYLHRDNFNIARCPHAFPIYVTGKLEALDAVDSARKLHVRIQLAFRWSSKKNQTKVLFKRPLKARKPHMRIHENETSVSNYTDGTNLVNQSTVTDGTNLVNQSTVTKSRPQNSSCDSTPDSLWIPQFFIAPSQPTPLLRNSLTANENSDIIEDGNTFVLLRTFFSTVWCKVSFERYPFDKHTCIFYIGLFQAQNYSLQLFWDPPATSEIGKYSLQGYETRVTFHNESVLEYKMLDNREVSRLPIVIKLKRLRSCVMLHIYLPSCLMALLAWLGFYIPDELAEGRVFVAFLNLLGSVRMLYVIYDVPETGSIKAIDVWLFSISIFIWTSVVACLFDLEYEFRGIEREQTESVGDVMFFYRQPKLARQLADSGHREELERQRGSDANLLARLRARHQRTSVGQRLHRPSASDGGHQAPSLGAVSGEVSKTSTDDRQQEQETPRQQTPTPTAGQQEEQKDAGGRSPWTEHNRRKSRFDQHKSVLAGRQMSTVVDGELFFDAQLDYTPAGERVEWSDFYLWVHERHASRRPTPDEMDELEGGSLTSVQSLLQSMWNIRKEYRWQNWADYVKKCVETIYPVLFCVFLVIYYLVYAAEDDVHETVI